MCAKKLWALCLATLLALCLLTGCGGSTYSSKLSIVINDAQTILDLSHSGQLDRALRKALADYQAGEDINVIRDRVIEELGLEDVVYFSSSGVSNARDGQHAVQVFRIEGGTSDNAIDQLSAQIAEILKALTSDGQYDGAVSMIEKDGVFYAVVDLHVIQSGSGTSGGGKPAVTLASIAVTTPPTKTTYHVNEAFDKTGMRITATFSDGSIKDVTNECDISPTQFTSYGQQQVTITYEDQTTTTTVIVLGLQSITVTSGPNKKDYTTGETFDTAGIVLTATYTDGATTTNVTGITTGITASSNAFTTAGENIQVQITYTNDYGQTASITVNVKVTQVGIESEDNYTIPANVISDLDAIFQQQVNQEAATDGYTLDATLTDPAIQVKINQAMKAFSGANFTPMSDYKTYLRNYGIPVLDLTNEFQDISELDQVEKYYYAGGIQSERRLSEADQIWTVLENHIYSQFRTWNGDNILDKDDPYATNTYRYYINFSANQYYSEKYKCDMLNVQMTIIVERIRTPKA